MEISGQMIMFANVVDHGGFSATARDLGQSPSSVSKQISALETRLGVRLLNRSTRSISLTDEGRAFYERCANIASDVAAAEDLIASLNGKPGGTLRIAATVAFAKMYLLPLLPKFFARFPDLSVSLELTDKSIDFSNSNHDLAIRFSEQIANSSVVARKLATNKRVICAAPEYLEKFGTPETPEDLSAHNLLRLDALQHWNEWHFRRDGVEVVVRADGNFEANSADAIYHATHAGLGIARLSTYMVTEDIRLGRLKLLLSDYVDDDAGLYAVYPSRHLLSQRIRVFIDFLLAELGPEPPWDR